MEPSARLTSLILLTTALAGCSMLRSSGQTQQVLDGFRGHTLAEVADRFGPPQTNFPQTDNGEMTFEWDNLSLDRAPGTPPPAGATASGCRVWVSALPTYAGASPAYLTYWIVQSSQCFGCR